jgi:dTDP-4-amino-4,6-dideoxygalactose transaminase
MNIPLVDLKKQYESIKPEIDKAIADVISKTAFVGGSFLESFETTFAEFCKVKHCIGVGNGTDALFIALKSLGIGPGDEVIVPANSFIATSEAVTMTGARVAFVDIDPRTYNMDPNKLEDYLKKRCKVGGSRLEATHLNRRPATGSKSFLLKPEASDLHPVFPRLTPPTFNLKPRPRAVIPVHLYGQPADMDSILEIAKKYDLKVVEDAAQAHGAEYKGRPIGSIGDVGCFSFYPGKNLGAYGDGGAIVTNSEELALKARMFANHGRVEKYNHELEGVNSRLDSLQAAILKVKLTHLSDWNRRRRNNAYLYNKHLEGIPLGRPFEPKNLKAVYHLYVVRVKNGSREKLAENLKSKGISTGIHYPIALPNLRAYAYLKHKESDFPEATKASEEILSLPMFPELEEAEIKYISEKIAEAIS